MNLHFNRSTSLLALALVSLGFAGCSSGGAGTDRTNAADCAANGATFCLTACNLGCTVSGGCSVNSIAQNQPIELIFSQAIDPASVNTASISFKTAAGESPSGSFIVSANSIRFVPEVSLVAGITTFGFRAQEEYFLTLPGGPEERLSVASASGDRLARTVSCSVSIDRGLVDLNNRAPSGRMVSPLPDSRDLEGAPPIVIEFDELIDVSAFQGSSTSSTPVRYTLRRTDPFTGEPDPTDAPEVVPGVPIAEAILGVNPRTRITVQPLVDLPPSVCVEVSITDEVRDLAGTAAIPSTFRFYTSAGTVTLLKVEEDFTDGNFFDSSVSSANWGQGGIRPGTVGGDGLFGEFDIDVLPVIDGKSVWDTAADIVFPSAGTLLDQGDLVASNGRASFSKFVVPAGRTLRFVGPNAPVITVSGEMAINGTIESDGEDGVQIVPILPGPGASGGAGGAGGAGGSSGGRGADAVVPVATPATVPFLPGNFAEAGADLMPAPMSGYAGQVGGSGGNPGPLFPLGSDPNVADMADVNTRIAPQGLSDQQIPGAGGGGFFAPGGDGVIVGVIQPALPADRYEDPIAGGNGMAFALPPIGVSSFDHFLFGGAGGGGGGSGTTLVNPAPGLNAFAHWTNGIGGGGGGGALGVRVGGALSIGPAGRISLRGGSTPDTTSITSFARGSSVGGAGAGGCFVAQSGGSFTQDGVIDVRGGIGGTKTYNIGALSGQSRGGDGAPGYVRLESATATIPALGTVLGLAPTANNIGTLEDRDDRFVARSSWYALNAILEPRLLNFELTVRVGTDTIVFTDNPVSPNLPNVPGSPVTLKLQGAQVDPVKLEPVGEPGNWVDTTTELGVTSPTGLRFMLFLDTSVEADVEIEKFELFYEV